MRLASAQKELGVVAITKLATSLLVLATGFRAVSDDDFSRVVIAQQFANAPSWDPSGTSWLPVPFWLTGSAMRVFGPDLAVARVVAFVSGVASALLVYGAGRRLGCSGRGAMLGAVIACFVPWFAWLGVTTTPEALTASLLVLAACATASDDTKQRLLGALALLVATLSRYEAWPVALVFALFCAFDAWRSRSALHGMAGAFALLGPYAWLVHGVHAHGNALFFVKRVVSYRRALGTPNVHTGALLVDFAERLVSPLPLILLLLATAFLARRSARELERLRRPLACSIALLAFLIAGEISDGAPTHHAERALLPVWLLLALVTGELVARLPHALHSSARRAAGAAGVCLALTALLAQTLWIAARAHEFAARTAELAMGRAAAELAASERDPKASRRLLIDTQDFGYFAVMAAFARPADTAVLRDHDPRRGDSSQPASESSAIREAATREGARWLVAPASRNEELMRWATRRAANTQLVLLEVPSVMPALDAKRR